MLRKWTVLAVLMSGVGCGGGGGTGDPSATVLFEDGFARADGDLGSDWQGMTFSGIPLPPPHLDSGRAASDGQAMVMVSRSFSIDRVRIRCTFEFESAAEAEVYLLADNDSEMGNNMWAAGLDGTGNTGGTPIVAEIVSGQGVSGSPLGLQPGVPYVLEALFDNGTVSMWVRQADGTQIAQLQMSFPGFHPNRFGFLVGREANGLLSFVDDFRIESAD